MIKYLLLALLLLIFTQKLSATDAANSAFASALQLQKDKQYTEAIAAYESILASGQSSAQLHNNLALAYAETDKVGKAVLHILRALDLDLHNEDAQQNYLAIEQRIKGDSIKVNSKDLGFMAVLRGFSLMLSSTTWAILSLIFSAVFSLLLIFKYKLRFPLRRLLGTGSAVLLFAFFSWLHTSRPNRGVLMQPEIALREEANLASKETHKIYEGTSFTILKTEGEWLQIYLNDGSIGWLPANTTERVTSYE